MLRRLIRDFRQLHWALQRYYSLRASRLTPEQEAERAIARLNREQREQEARRRLSWRR